MAPLILPHGETPDAELRSCADCASLASALTWWCTLKDAAKYRGTTLPGVIHCPFWSPAPVEGPPGFFARMFGR